MPPRHVPTSRVLPGGALETTFQLGELMFRYFPISTNPSNQIPHLRVPHQLHDAVHGKDSRWARITRGPSLVPCGLVDVSTNNHPRHLRAWRRDSSLNLHEVCL